MKVCLCCIPIRNKYVPACLERIIDKKISGVALSCLEKWADLFFSWVYCPYSNLFKAKSIRPASGTPIYDETTFNIGGVAIKKQNYISLYNKCVLFSSSGDLKHNFKREEDTKYLTLRNMEPNVVQITEYKTSQRGPFTWLVNLNKIYSATYAPEKKIEEIYVAEVTDRTWEMTCSSALVNRSTSSGVL